LFPQTTYYLFSYYYLSPYHLLPTTRLLH